MVSNQTHPLCEKGSDGECKKEAFKTPKCIPIILGI